MAEQFEAERTRAKDALALSRAFQQKYYNQGRLTKEFEEGDLVVLNPHSLDMVKRNQDKGDKLLMRYDGPFEIVRKLSPITYQLRLPANYRMHPVLNIAHLEKYEQSPPEFGVRPTTRMRPEEFQDLVQEVEIERIVQQRMFKAPGKNRRITKYKVRFKGFPPNEDEWKTRKQLKNALLILKEWEIQRNNDRHESNA